MMVYDPFFLWKKLNKLYEGYLKFKKIKLPAKCISNKSLNFYSREERKISELYIFYKLVLNEGNFPLCFSKFNDFLTMRKDMGEATAHDRSKCLVSN